MSRVVSRPAYGGSATTVDKKRLLRRTAFGLVLAVVAPFVPSTAYAGGFELPDLGSQAVGRGAAFVAKADDPTAIYYNPAGLARQRGTKLLLDGNLYLHSFTFQRLGTYQDDPNDPQTSWGQAQFPAVKNTAGPFPAPFVALATDFGYFDRATFAVGLFTPSMIGNRTFPLGVSGKPSPTRYDYVQSRTSILYPTASVGIRVAKWLDLGVSTHLALAKIDMTSTLYADTADCKNAEYFGCDSRATLAASGTSFAATFGALIRPAPSYAFGLSLRTPVTINAAGTMTPEEPKKTGDIAVAPGPATYGTQLPLMLKIGGRYIGMDEDYELYDLELDATYETWGTSQAQGPVLQAAQLGDFSLKSIILHQYTNTFGIRAGGAYNVDTGDGVLSLRGGAYYDGSATSFPTTRVDHDTLTKIAGTIGIGYRYGGFTLNLGYAAIASIPRLVGSDQGRIRPMNGLKGGSGEDKDGGDLGAVNEGSYRGFTHILSLGITISFDHFIGTPRPIMYGNSYEPNYAGSPDDDSAKKPEEKKPEEKKPEEKKPEEKKPEEKKPEEKKPPKPPPDEGDDDDDEIPEKKPEKKPEPKPEPPPEVKKATPPPPPPKPPTKRKEWWEED